MRVVVVGLGVQGEKRRRFAGTDYVASVDPIRPDADYRSVEEVPLADYDAALVCVPDEPKLAILGYLIDNRKDVLVEKPLFAPDEASIVALEARAQKSGVVCYTAYNHRFEPHFVRMRELVALGALGRIYHCRMFYGNGTARLVRDSAWRDTGGGVLPDLGSHLLDTTMFWFGDVGRDFQIVFANRFENRAPDHVVVASSDRRPTLEFEMTLLMWRNHFACDIFAENGSAHIRSLCKWGPSSFIRRTRMLPSGRPPEESVILVQEDPTWALEYDHFKALCVAGGPTDLSNDRIIHSVLSELTGSLSAGGGA